MEKKTLVQELENRKIADHNNKISSIATALIHLNGIENEILEKLDQLDTLRAELTEAAECDEVLLENIYKITGRVYSFSLASNSLIVGGTIAASRIAANSITANTIAVAGITNKI